MASSKKVKKEIIKRYRFDNGPHRRAMLLSIGDLIRGKKNNEYWITSEYTMCKVLEIDPTHTPAHGEDAGDIKVQVIRVDMLRTSDWTNDDHRFTEEYWVDHDEFIKLTPDKINMYNVDRATGQQWVAI